MSFRRWTRRRRSGCAPTGCRPRVSRPQAQAGVPCGHQPKATAPPSPLIFSSHLSQFFPRRRLLRRAVVPPRGKQAAQLARGAGDAADEHEGACARRPPARRPAETGPASACTASPNNAPLPALRLRGGLAATSACRSCSARAAATTQPWKSSRPCDDALGPAVGLAVGILIFSILYLVVPSAFPILFPSRHNVPLALGSNTMGHMFISGLAY